MRNCFPLVLLILSGLVGASSPPETVSPESLVTGVWHARVQEEDYLFEITLEEGNLGGRMHRVVGERQMLEVPFSGVSLDGERIEIALGMFPPYVGEVELEGGRIRGGVPGVPPFQEMNLTRIDAAQWPMLRARPMSKTEESDSTWTRPEQLDDGWPTGVPADHGVDSAAVETTIRAILAGEAGAIHSLLVARDGSLLVEEYFHGWSRNDPHRIASCTKSVASILRYRDRPRAHRQRRRTPARLFS